MRDTDNANCYKWYGPLSYSYIYLWIFSMYSIFTNMKYICIDLYICNEVSVQI